MNSVAAIALFGWVPLCIAAFAALAPRSAALLCMIGGWCLLPVASYSVAGLPDFTKTTAVSLGALLGLALFARGSLAGLRLSRCDLPMLLWCAVPAASSLANGHGAYDAVAVTLARTVDWGIPYLIGRALFRDVAAVEQLVRGICLGGLLYVPLCLFEVRMSPQLHATVYGFAQHSFAQHMRQDGYRPMVFMEHGLMVALWMAVATAAAWTLWRHGTLRRLAGLHAGLMLVPLLATTLLCRSLGALVLMVVGLVALAAVRAFRSTVPILVLVALPVLFVVARLGLDWQAPNLIELVSAYAPDRARSLAFRIDSENVLLSGFWQRPWLGWSAWGFAQPAGDTPVARDSYWIITASCFGLAGLALFFWVQLAPIVALVRRVPASEWAAPRSAGVTVLVVVLCLFVGDCMFNAMLNPVYTVALGSVTTLAAAVERRCLDADARVHRRRPRVLSPCSQ